MRYSHSRSTAVKGRKNRYRPAKETKLAVSVGPGSSIGTSYGNFLDQVGIVQNGLPTEAIEVFRRSSGIPVGRINQIAGISVGTYNRRKISGRLSADESERLLRLSRVFEKATDLYRGDRSAARVWLETTILSLGNQSPLELARTDPGAREVEDLIGRIQNGIVS